MSFAPHGINMTAAIIGATICLYILRLKNMLTPCGLGDCQTVLNSSYGQFAGLPTALYGLIFFLVLFGTTLFLPLVQEQYRSQITVMLLIWTVAGTFVVGFLTFYSLVELQAFCPLCLSTAALVVTSLGSSIWLIRKR